jgi:hypothetical protein
MSILTQRENILQKNIYKRAFIHANEKEKKIVGFYEYVPIKLIKVKIVRYEKHEKTIVMLQ